MATKTRDLRKLSKYDWCLSNSREKPTVEEINTGSFLRIADSLELIAKSKTELEEEVQRLREKAEYYRDYARRQNERLNDCRNSRAGYKGRMNHLQSKINIIKGEFESITQLHIDMPKDEFEKVQKAFRVISSIIFK